MTDLPLLVTIAVALAYALVGGVIARRLGLPSIVGYLIAGVALGPFTPGFHGDPALIRQLAELGVILLMFGVGLHFSLRDLWQVRGIAVPGAMVQMAAIAGAGYLLASGWGWSVGGAWLFGIAASVASTVVLMRGLMDHGWLEKAPGRAAIGWSVFEDLVTVAILVLLPVLVGHTSEGSAAGVLLAIGKAAAFLALMFLAGTRLIPWILKRIADTRSRELFVLVALTTAVGTALAAARVFDVSLALGAFVAGIVVAESPFSHQVSADLLPFREAFAVLFFVSIGMLVNPSALAAQWGHVLALSLLIVIGKAVVCALTVFALPHPVKTALVIAAGRSQIGEFSFIVGQSGVMLGLIDDTQYSLILAGAIVSITVNPLMFGLVSPLERALMRWPRAWRVLNHQRLDLPAIEESIAGHVVIVGCGRVGRHIAEVLTRLQLPRLVVEDDPARLRKLVDLGIPVLFGDAANSEILRHAALGRARAAVVTVPDDTAAAAIVAAIRHFAPSLPIIARASSWAGARRLTDAGAHEVIRPELEGGIEIVRRTLLELEYLPEDATEYAAIIRQDGLEDEGASQSAIGESAIGKVDRGI